MGEKYINLFIYKKINILFQSIPAFIAATQPDKEHVTFMLLLKKIITYTNTGLISKEKDFDNTAIIEKLLSKIGKAE